MRNLVMLTWCCVIFCGYAVCCEVGAASRDKGQPAKGARQVSKGRTRWKSTGEIIVHKKKQYNPYTDAYDYTVAHDKVRNNQGFRQATGRYDMSPMMRAKTVNTLKRLSHSPNKSMARNARSLGRAMGGGSW